MLCAYLHLLHIDTAGEIKKFIQQVTMTVLFRCPHSYPFTPSLWFFLCYSIYIQQPAFISWQCFFGDRITDKNGHIIVRKLFAFCTQFFYFVGKIFTATIG